MVEYPRKPKFRSTYDPAGAGQAQQPSLPGNPGRGAAGPPGASPGPAGPPGPQQPPGRPPAPQADAANTISRTTLPPRQHIRCFECGYEFNLTGRMHSTYCPKCRTTLDLAGYTIDSDCSEPLKTLGTIRITRRGAVSSTRLVATDIELSGKMKNCTAQAFGVLAVHPGAEFTRKDITSSDLRIEAGAAVQFRSPAVYRNVDVLGKLSGDFYVTGTLTVRAEGSFEGSICGGHLVVDEGGVLNGAMNISAEGFDEAEKKRIEFKDAPPAALEQERVLVPALPDPDDIPPA